MGGVYPADSEAMATSNWPSEAAACRSGVVLTIERPEGDHGRLVSCVVFDDGDDAAVVPAWSHYVSTSRERLNGEDLDSYRVEFPGGFDFVIGTATPKAAGRFSYEWKADYGEVGRPEPHVVALGEFGIP